MLRADPVPVDRLRRPDPAEAAELPDHRLLPRGDAARARVRRADRRRLGRQGEADRAGAARRARQRQGHDRGGDRDRARVRADLRRTRARSCARRRCSARPTSSSRPAPSPATDAAPVSLGAAANVSDAEARVGRVDPRGRHARRSAGPRRRPRSTRSSTPSTRRRGPSFQRWQQNAAIGDQRPRPRPQRLVRQPRPVRHRRLRRSSTCSAARRRRSRAWSATPGTVFDGARPSATRQLAGAITGSDNTFDALASEDQALAETFQILPTFQRETRATLERLDSSRPTRSPLIHDLIPVARDLARRCARCASSRRTCATCSSTSTPLEAASTTGFPALRDFLGGLRAGARPARPVPRQPQPGAPLPRVPEEHGHRLPRRPGVALSGQYEPASPATRRRAAACASSATSARRRSRSGPAACRPTAATATCSRARSTATRRPRTGSSPTSTARTPTTSPGAAANAQPTDEEEILPGQSVEGVNDGDPPGHDTGVRALLHPGRLPRASRATTSAAAASRACSRIPRQIRRASRAASRA